MPNTIAHFAVNGLISRALISNADLKWIYLACVIPDIPWILQRILRSLPWALDLYDIRAYCIAQSSFLVCIFLCLALSFLAKQRGKVFLILILGCVLHLLVDALQIKWANGVQMLAPFDWQLFRFDLFWPESMGTYLLTVAGLIYLIANIAKVIQPNCNEFVISLKSVGVAAIFGLIWLVLPIAFISSVYQADNHFIATLKDADNRADKPIEIDRNTLAHLESGAALLTSFGEVLLVENINADDGDLISIQGRFIGNDAVYVENYHVHSKFRDYASMFGLACVLLIWLIFISRCLLSNQQKV